MAEVDNAEFFAEQQEHSYIKSCIVTDYFWAWAQVMIGTGNKYPQHGKKMAYIDLFSGPGKYADGTESTPLLIMRKVLSNPDLCDRLVTVFNDKEEGNSKTLQEALDGLPGIEKLKFKPQVNTGKVDEELSKQFEQTRMVPTFLFVDPFGYKGLSLRLVGSVVRNFGSDCVFFFNYNRINPGTVNDSVTKYMKEIFGEERAARIRQRFEMKSAAPHEREALIVDEMKTALEESVGKFVLPFKFYNPQGTRTSHHLFFVSKAFRGYSIMRDIMYRYSHKDENVARFEHNPADRDNTSIFELMRPLGDLEDLLLADYADRSIFLTELFESHSVGKPYVLKNYREALCRMEKDGKVSMEPPFDKRKPGTIGPKVKITFPRRPS